MASVKLLSILFVSCLVLTSPVSSENTNINGTRGASVLWSCGHDLSYPFQPADSRIFWQNGIVFHVYNKGREEFENQNKTFANRTKIFPDQLASGNFSLLFDPLKLADDRTSLKVVFMTSKERQTNLCQRTLYVGVPFQEPKIEINRTMMTASCSTQGGYPEPEIKWTLWNISQGLEQTLEPEEARTSVAREADGTYSINSTVNVTGAQNVTCSVYNPTLNETVSAPPTQIVPADESRNHWAVPIGFCICICICIVGWIIYKRQHCQQWQPAEQGGEPQHGGDAGTRKA